MAINTENPVSIEAVEHKYFFLLRKKFNPMYPSNIFCTLISQLRIFLMHMLKNCAYWNLR